VLLNFINLKILHNKIPNYLLSTIKCIYRNMKVRIKFNDDLSEPIYINKGLRQGCGLLPLLFNIYEVLPKISENLNIPRKPLALRTYAARHLFLYLSTNSLATGIFISAHVSEFWMFLLHHFHECLRISKWRELRSKELALNFASSSTKLQLRPTEC